jgi:alkyl hydroperoxide reductase subunit AhpC
MLTLHSLRLGTIAPNFKAETTTGPIDFHEFIGDKWVVLFSHPEDYTPVCTTELGAFAKLEPEFTRRGVKLIGLSANTIESHGGWIKDIDEISGSNLKFPIIGDKQRQVALAYDMLDHQDATNVDSKGIAFTIRSVFIIDPKKTIRTILSYPASTGRNTAEVLRIVDSLQTGDKHRVTTPINWVPGDDVIVPRLQDHQAIPTNHSSTKGKNQRGCINETNGDLGRGYNIHTHSQNQELYTIPRC